MLNDARTRESYFKLLIGDYRKSYRGNEPPLKESATEIYDQVTQSSAAPAASSTSSWLRQVDFGARIATAKVKRSLVDRKIHTAKV